MELNNFVKSHGLGNEYVVFDEEKISFCLTESAIKRICNKHFGIGSDGILLKTKSNNADFAVRIFNPDGSEAEKSGNGLRIFCKFLYDYGYTTKKTFTVETAGGIITANIVEEINNKAHLITVDMGKANFIAHEIPVSTDKNEFIDEEIEAGGKKFKVNCVSLGNPHCVIIVDELDEDEVKTYGPYIENHKLFPNRINVQFAKVLSKNDAEILIWERGAGYTLASGSSSCAVASVLIKKGLTNRDVNIHMKGGTLKISIDEMWNIRMTGEVREIIQGRLSDELIEDLNKPFTL